MQKEKYTIGKVLDSMYNAASNLEVKMESARNKIKKNKIALDQGLTVAKSKSKAWRKS